MGQFTAYKKLEPIKYFEYDGTYQSFLDLNTFFGFEPTDNTWVDETSPLLINSNNLYVNVNINGFLVLYSTGEYIGADWDSTFRNGFTLDVATGTFGRVVVENGIIVSGKKSEVFSGTTNINGVYAITFATPFDVAPNIQANIVNQTRNDQYLRISSISTTGFSVYAHDLSGADLSGVQIDVLINEK